MTQEIQDRINQALDDAMESFRDDPDCIFSTEVERLQLKYRDRPKVNAWKKNKSPVGLEGLTSQKYIVLGDGQVRQ